MGDHIFGDVIKAKKEQAWRQVFLPVPASIVALSSQDHSVKLIRPVCLFFTLRTFLVLPELKKEVKVWESTQSEWL